MNTKTPTTLMAAVVLLAALSSFAFFTSGCTIEHVNTVVLTKGQAAASFAPALCQAAERCNATTFPAQYPGGVDQCAQETEAKVTSPDAATTSCTQADMDACVADLAGYACRALYVDNTLPASCGKC